jgi:hypothetical protein
MIDSFSCFHWLLFIVVRPTQEFHLYGDVTITGEGLQNSVCSALSAFLYRAIPAVTVDLGFSCLIRRTAPFCRLT